MMNDVGVQSSKTLTKEENTARTLKRGVKDCSVKQNNAGEDGELQLQQQGKKEKNIFKTTN